MRHLGRTTRGWTGRSFAEAGATQRVHCRPCGWEYDSSGHHLVRALLIARLHDCTNVLCALKERVPILRLCPDLEVVKGDVGKLAAERAAIDGVADTVEPLV